MKSVKLVTVGDQGVGKTCWLSRTADNYFPPADDTPHFYEDYGSNIQFDGEPIHVWFWDTDGRGDDFDKLRPLSYPDTHVFLVLFSLVSPSSFESVSQKWVPEIQSYQPNTPWILLGTKADLRADPSHECVDEHTAQSLADEMGAQEYLECSALSGLNMSTSLERALDCAVRFQENAQSDGVSGDSSKDSCSSCVII